MMVSTLQTAKLWAKRVYVREVLSLSDRKLDEVVTDGFVRTVKDGEAQQAPRLFFVPDIETYLLTVAEGGVPERPVGKRTGAR